MADEPTTPTNFDDLPALDVSAELAACRLEESASILHRWLRRRCEHDAIAVTVNGSVAALSLWTSAAFAVPTGLDWSAATVASALARPVVAASGGAAASSVTVLVVPTADGAPGGGRLKGPLAALARVVAARIGSLPSETDRASVSVAHAVASERDRVTRELTDHFAQYLHTILNRLGDQTSGDACARLQSATSVASRALVELREHRRPVWRQARRVDDAFGALESHLGELARSAGIQLDRALLAPQAQILPNRVLDAAASITRAAMLNIIEHAGAGRARINWHIDAERLAVSVVDDGSGFDPQHAAHGGLDAMRRRAGLLGGSFEVASTPSWGTRILASLPLRADSAVPADESASARVGTLRDRELAILRLLAVGHRNREIADELFLSPHTVKFHVGNLFEKLGVRTRAEAAAVAFAAGLQSASEPVAA
ncbi:LuxR C-terminal-related transcriptional regulator [Solirubrobacter ginsenosidimutans]|uniref:LuxR C-terminal-related transcriptional regulator n=1 Tax=Solirubrobacter ginsenosidimutans TaxID=490573 RepID=UPI0022CE2904|nr:LuxR C-terminal-related transcriptional regulator [Solirubrobacter ginsenosidimutans]